MRYPSLGSSVDIGGCSANSGRGGIAQGLWDRRADAWGGGGSRGKNGWGGSRVRGGCADHSGKESIPRDTSGGLRTCLDSLRKNGCDWVGAQWKKGTEAGVVGATIRRMREEFGSEPNSMLALLGPCIRPPHYEVNIAGEILRQLEREKVGKVVDSGLCTASDLTRFYSYRAEKGQTGRHFAVFAG